MPNGYIYEDGTLVGWPDEPSPEELQARDQCEQEGHPYNHDDECGGRCYCGACQYPAGGPAKEVGRDA